MFLTRKFGIPSGGGRGGDGGGVSSCMSICHLTSKSLDQMGPNRGGSMGADNYSEIYLREALWSFSVSQYWFLATASPFPNWLGGRFAWWLVRIQLKSWFQKCRGPEGLISGDRGIFMVRGQFHQIRLEFFILTDYNQMKVWGAKIQEGPPSTMGIFSGFYFFLSAFKFFNWWQSNWSSGPKNLEGDEARRRHQNPGTIFLVQNPGPIYWQINRYFGHDITWGDISFLPAAGLTQAILGTSVSDIILSLSLSLSLYK